MSFQCLSVSNLASNIRNKNLGLVCKNLCDYYDLILFDFIEDTESTDCSTTDYTDDYVYVIPYKDYPSQEEITENNTNILAEASIDCTGGSIVFEPNTDLTTCSNEILIEFINEDGVVTNNPNNASDMRDNYYEITFNGAKTLTLPSKTLLQVIVFIPTATTTIKTGTMLGADNIVFEETIDTSATNYPYTLNTYYESSTTLYFNSTATIKARIYVD